MTSTLATISQINPEVKYIFAVSITKAWVPTSKLSSYLYESDFSSLFTGITDIPANTQMRDMGKFITVINTSGMHVATLRRVQTVNGPDTEGVPNNWNGNGQYYVSVWTDTPISPFNVTVVRSG